MVDWYKLAVGVSAVSAANSLKIANEQNQAMLSNVMRNEQRNKEIFQSRRILQNIGSLIDNIDNEVGSNESKLLSLMIGNFVMMNKGLSTTAFDDMEDIKYASEIYAKYTHKIHSLSSNVDQNISNNLYDKFVSSGFSIDELGFYSTVTRPFLLEICACFANISKTEQYSLEIQPSNYVRNKFMELNIQDFGIFYTLQIHWKARSGRYEVKNSEGESLGKFMPINSYTHEFVISGIENDRSITISLIHDRRNKKWPKEVTIQTQEGYSVSKEIPTQKISEKKGDGYCIHEGCKRLVFRQLQYCHEHK